MKEFERLNSAMREFGIAIMESAEILRVFSEMERISKLPRPKSKFHK